MFATRANMLLVANMHELCQFIQDHIQETVHKNVLSKHSNLSTFGQMSLICTHLKLVSRIQTFLHMVQIYKLRIIRLINCILPVLLTLSMSSQIPSSAVEMPGSADVSGLNVQFGALDFGSEAGSGVVDMTQMESAREQAPAPAPISVPTAVPTQQPQSSLFSKPGSMRWVYV